MNEASQDITYLDWADIVPGRNPRKFFDPAKMEELKASILEHGVRQNLTVCEDETEEGRYLIVSGERRHRAVGELLAWLDVRDEETLTLHGEAVPVDLLYNRLRRLPVQILTAEEAPRAYELSLVENLQREGLTPLEEAEAYKLLSESPNPETGRPYTHAEIAQKVGKLDAEKRPDASYIRRRLKLRNAPDVLLEAVNTGAVGATVAEVVGRIPDGKSREECARLVLKPKDQVEPLNVAQTKALVQERFMVSLRGCGFNLEDVELLPVETDEHGQRVAGGACDDCPWLSGNNPELAEDLAGGTAGRRGSRAGIAADLCTNPACYRRKQDAVWMTVRRAAEARGQKCLDGDAADRVFSGEGGELSPDGGYARPDSAPHGAIVGWRAAPSWRELMKGTGVKLVVVRNPNTHAGELLVPIKEVIAAVKKKAREAGMPCVFDVEKAPEPEPDDAPEASEGDGAEGAIESRARELLLEAMEDRLRVMTPGNVSLGAVLARLCFARLAETEIVPNLIVIKLGYDPDRHDTTDGRDTFEKQLSVDLRGDPQSGNRWLALLLAASALDSVPWGEAVQQDDDVMDLAEVLGCDIAACYAQAEKILAAKAAGKRKARS